MDDNKPIYIGKGLPLYLSLSFSDKLDIMTHVFYQAKLEELGRRQLQEMEFRRATGKQFTEHQQEVYEHLRKHLSALDYRPSREAELDFKSELNLGSKSSDQRIFGGGHVYVPLSKDPFTFIEGNAGFENRDFTIDPSSGSTFDFGNKSPFVNLKPGLTEADFDDESFGIELKL